MSEDLFTGQKPGSPCARRLDWGPGFEQSFQISLFSLDFEVFDQVKIIVLFTLTRIARREFFRRPGVVE